MISEKTILIITFILLFVSCVKQEVKQYYSCNCTVDKGLPYKEKNYNHSIFDSKQDANSKCWIIEDDYRDNVNNVWGSASCHLLLIDSLY